MIHLIYDPKIDKKNLNLIIDTKENFQDCVDLLKIGRCSWNPTVKAWTIGISEFDSILELIQNAGEMVSIDAFTAECVKKFKESLNELQLSKKRITFNQNLLNFPPFRGKSPNENFQIQDILRGLNQNRFLYNHEMGLGKSYILSALLSHLYKNRLAGKFLIFSSPIGIMNLRNEIIKFLNFSQLDLTEQDIVVFPSAGVLPFDKRNVFDSNNYPQKIIIMTYDLLKTVGNYYYDQLKATKRNPHPSTKTKWTLNVFPIETWLEGNQGCLLLDECHQLGNRSRRTEIMEMVIPFFQYRYLFTGTFADKYEKLYQPCLILDRALVEGKTYNNWLSTYNELGNRFSKYAVNPERWNLKKIGELNEKLLTRYGSKRMLTECMDLPPNYDLPTIYIEMSPKQRKIYEAFSNYTLKTQLSMAKSANRTLTDRAKIVFQYVQTAIDNPSCFLYSEKFCEFDKELQKLIKGYNYEKDCEKLKVLDEILKERIEDIGQKGILWYYHPETVETLKNHYQKYQPYIVSAEVPKEERVPLVNQFIQDPKSYLLVASVNIMNTSITVTEAKFMCYLENTFNYSNFLQSKKRNYRFGQTETTYNYYIRYNNSLDLLQEKNLESKGQLMNSLMNKDFISKDLWKQLFNLKQNENLNL